MLNVCVVEAGAAVNATALVAVAAAALGIAATVAMVLTAAIGRF